MTLDNEQTVRKAYQIAEDRDLEGWVAAFTDAEARANHTMPIRYTFRLPNRSPSEPPSTRNAASVRM